MRIAIERSDNNLINDLLEKGVIPLPDIILPEGIYSNNQKIKMNREKQILEERIKAAQQQYDLEQQQEEKSSKSLMQHGAYATSKTSDANRNATRRGLVL